MLLIFHGNQPQASIEMAEINQLREAAEVALDKLPQTGSEGTSEAVVLQVHELWVHQIELEMQNEELRRAQMALEESQSRYFELYDLAPVGYLTLSDEGVILQANLTAAGLLGVLRSRLINRRITKFIVEHDWPIYFGHRKELLGTAAAETCELRLTKPDGSFFWAQMTSNVIRQTLGVPAFRVTLSDITVNKRQELAIEARDRLLVLAQTSSLEDLLRATLDEAEALTGSVAGFYHFLETDQTTLSLQAWSANTERNLCRKVGVKQHYPVNEAGVWVDCIRQRRAVIHNDYAALPDRKGLPEGHLAVQRELVVPVLRRGLIVAILGVGNKASDYTVADSQSVEVLADFAWDIVENKRQADKLQEYHHLLNAIVDNSPSSIFAFDLQHRFILLNDAMGHFLGLPKEETLGKSITEVLPDELAVTLMATNSRIMASGEPLRIEEVVRSRAHKDPRALITMKFALRNARGEITGLGGVSSDVTDYESALADLRKSLVEKDSLLKEIHHRVKNNLQIVSSLLRLQASRVASPDTRTVLMDMEGRIHSMALVHEHLYLSENLAAVDLATYLRQLCNYLYHSLILIPGSVQLHLDISHVALPIDQAIPCGLLVNELVSNAFKHAFPNGRHGQLWVCLKPLADAGGWLLRVADDGVGLPPGLDLAHISSLGLKLASDLSRQLAAQLTLGSGPGAVLEVLCVPPSPADFPSSRK